MAEYIVRAWSIRLYNDPEGFPAASSTPYFQDVQPGDFGFAYIQKLYELGITKGCSGQSPTISFCPLDTLENIQVAIFVARARALADYGCTAPNYTAPLQTMPVSSDPNCVLDNYMASTSPFFADVQNVAPVSWFHAVQRLGDVGAVHQLPPAPADPSPLVISGSQGCMNCYFYEGNSTTRGQMAVWTVVGMGLDPRSILSIDGGANYISTLPTVTVPFTYTMHDQAFDATDIGYAQFYLADSASGVHCEGDWGPGPPSALGLSTEPPSSTWYTTGIGSDLGNPICTVKLVSINTSQNDSNITDPTEMQVTLNFTFNPGFDGTYTVMNWIYYDTGGYETPWQNVGSVTLETPLTRNPAPTVTLTDNTQNSGYYFVGDSFTLTVTGATLPPNLPVSVSINGVDYGVQGSINSSGVFTVSGTWTSANIGSYAETWYVSGQAAGPTLPFSVNAVPPPSTVQLTNLSFSGTSFQVGNQYSFQGTGGPSAPVALVAQQTTDSGQVINATIPLGETDAQGNFNFPGTWGSSDIGTWADTITVWGIPATPNPIPFTVAAVSCPLN